MENAVEVKTRSEAEVRTGNAARAKALSAYDVLGTAPEPAFDDLARLAASICDAPVALINFMGEDRQWFKAAVGVDLDSVPLDVGFCPRVLDQQALVMIEDTHASEETARNPAVHNALGVRFYAGTPLRTEDGVILGTLSVIDRKPRTLTPVQAESLRALGRQVTTQLELRRALQERERYEALLTEQARVLERIATNAPLCDVLDTLMRAFERLADGMVAGILLADEVGEHLHPGGGPGLPDAYSEALDGIRVASDVGPCALAAHEARQVIMEDIEADERWPAFRKLALEHGFRACWSTPISSSEGDVLGTFAFYYRKPRRPGPWEFKLIDTAVHLAGIAIQHKRAERELESARRQVRVSEKLSALGTLVSGVAHEIRTPLTFITNNAYLTRRRLEDADGDPARLAAVRADLEAHQAGILEGAERINNLVTELRRYTKLEVGTRAAQDVHEVVTEAVDLFRATHRGEARVEAILEPVPPVVMDRAQIQQVVLNLLENAVEATGPAEAPIRVRVRAADAGVEIAVEDEGPGVPEAARRRLFDAFYTTKPDGLGLGLSIVRRIVEGHRGSVRLGNRKRGGARFTVVLPRE